MTLRLTRPAPGGHRLSSVYTNWYLLEAGGRLTVLDAGLPGDWREFLSALSRLGHTPAVPEMFPMWRCLDSASSKAQRPRHSSRLVPGKGMRYRRRSRARCMPWSDDVFPTPARLPGLDPEGRRGGPC